jgi:hypothetical protein
MSNHSAAVISLIVAMFFGGLPLAVASEVIVYKSATCGCCNNWIAHMKQNGFTVKAVNVADPVSYKTRYGVPLNLASCHTALVEGYVIEGHVPAADIKRLLKQRPKVSGLIVPGMPDGSPGMEQGNPPVPYDVLTFDNRGKVMVYSRH